MIRVSALLITLALAFVSYTYSREKLGAHAPAMHDAGARESASLTSAAAVTKKVDFAKEVRPIFESRCTPCHFEGGKMYERLPFDRPATIKTLGDKLFTRIKDENEQRVLREFLAQQ